jgi:hypothetical protein
VSFDAFVETAWNDHGDRPRVVADRLAASLHVVTAPEHVAPYARIVTHVFGEHLGEWERGVRMLESLRGLPAFDRSPAVEGAVARGIGALRYAEGDAHALDALTSDDRIVAIATAASAFAGLAGFKRALAAYGQALALAEAGLAPGSSALRALAIGGNNLASALEGKRDRDGVETRGMIVAAEAALRYWTLAGTWLEEERAHYRLARSLLRARRPRDAVESARRCVDVCERNDAPAFERFFGHAVLAVAQRDAGDVAEFEASRREAARWHEQVPEGERHWCSSDLDELRG